MLRPVPLGHDGRHVRYGLHAAIARDRRRTVGHWAVGYWHVSPAGRSDGIRRVSRRHVPYGRHGSGFAWPLLRRGLAGQHMPRRLAHRDRASLRFEADDQADFFLRPAHLVPRKPYAVGVADLRLAVMGWKLIRREDVLPVGFRRVAVAAGLVEGIDGQRPLDLDGRFALALVEHQASPESTLRRLIDLGQHGVGPDCHDLVRLPRLLFLVEGPRGGTGRIPRGANGRQRKPDHRDQQLCTKLGRPKKRGQSPFVQRPCKHGTRLRAVPANGDCPLFFGSTDPERS